MTAPRPTRKHFIAAGMIVAVVGSGLWLFFGFWRAPAASQTGYAVSTPKKTLRPTEVSSSDGAATIRDRGHFQELAYQGDEVLVDKFLAGLEFVKFTFDGATTDDPRLYFINTKKHRAHTLFGTVVGLPYTSPTEQSDDQMKGVLIYWPLAEARDGSQGVYTFEFEPTDAYRFEQVKLCYDHLLKKMPDLNGRVGYLIRGPRTVTQYRKEKSDYDQSEIQVYFEHNLIDGDVDYIPLNQGETIGRLRVLNIDERPEPEEVVLFRSLPNSLSRVAGIITTVPQTPLSHVNLRAVQDNVPNAYIADAADLESIIPLIGQWVLYRVKAQGYEIRLASDEEVRLHLAKKRYQEKFTPQRDLSLTMIRSLDDIRFEDSVSVGVKAANVGELRRIDLPAGAVPQGAAIPFYFYDEFMKHNGFYQDAQKLLSASQFRRDAAAREELLKRFQVLIKKGKMPAWMMQALSKLQSSFPAGTPIRCRSSTNNEDLPEFSGAGLYDSFTHHPREGHLSKSIKQVYASMWNLRAFEEREFYQIDHLSASMGVLVHPNYQDEQANGVAVSDDVFYQSKDNYYFNTQIGEELVTNPSLDAIPEELLVNKRDSGKFQIVRAYTRSPSGRLILSAEHREQLRGALEKIHAHFENKYEKTQGEKFAMEIEFKISHDGRLVIKQARPWIYQRTPDQTRVAKPRSRNVP